jgi:chromosome segregation ATPase
MPKTLMEDTPELNEASRIVARLALDKLKQDGTLGVRQREQLRRAFSTAAEALDWDAIPGDKDDRVARATKDVAKLAAAGAHALEQDLAELLEEKKAEMEQLAEAHAAVMALAADAKTEYPAEVEYSHTARDGLRRLVTKTEALTLADADEATSAAATLEKRLEGYAKLRDQMLEELEERQRQIDEMRDGLSGFVAASNRLVVEVLATLA